MSRPKRHHWWPQLQSKHWMNQNGFINVVRSDGSTFLTNPKDISVMKELYTRNDADGNPNTDLEEWFSIEIESPFREILDKIISLPNLTSESAPQHAQKKELVNSLGFVINKTVDFIEFTDTDINILSKYIAALLVRTPSYIGKLKTFHGKLISEGSTWGPFQRDDLIVQTSFNEMKTRFQTYFGMIAKSDFIFLKTNCDKEFLFSDIGIVANEPWHDGGIPFDIHVPLTPEISVGVFPVRAPSFKYRYPLSYVNSKGVSRMNRIIVGNAEKFIFSKSYPPINFITKHFGSPAPKCFGHRTVNGEVEVSYDKSRDF